MKLISIDPGPKESGVIVMVDGAITEAYGSMDNDDLLFNLEGSGWVFHKLAIEMVASYGMAVGKDVFETVLWIGRFIQAFGEDKTTLIYRKDVKMTLCNSMRAKDTNIRQALLDMHEPTGGGKTPQVGTKSNPGPLYGVSKHAWSALAVAKTYEALHA